MLASLEGLQTTRTQTHCRASYLKPGINWHWQTQWRNTILHQKNPNLPLLWETSYKCLWWALLPEQNFSHTLKHCKSLGCRGRDDIQLLVSKEVQYTWPFWRASQRSQTALKQLPPPQKGCKRTQTHKPKHELGLSDCHLVRKALQEAISVSVFNPTG